MLDGRWHERFLKFLAAALGVAAVLGTMVVGRSGKRALATAPPASWLTRSFAGGRGSANVFESTLNPSNVKSATFGRVWQVIPDDTVYAQPLFVYHVSGTSVPGTPNVLYVATAQNTVYALDADKGSQIWVRNFSSVTNPAPTSAQVSGGQGCEDQGNQNYKTGPGHVGILSTPVIDGSSGTIFVVTHIMENCPSGGCTSANMVYRLRALNIATGADRANSPSGRLGQDPTPVTGFDPSFNNQRASLAINNGVLYIPFSSFCDNKPYHGFVLAYNSTTLAPVGAFDAAPGQSQAGIWMSSQAPAIDPVTGNIFVATGNTQNGGEGSFDESVIGLSPSAGQVSGLTWQAPNRDNLNQNDLDLAVSGPTWVSPTEGPNGEGAEMVQGSKTGDIFALTIHSGALTQTDGFPGVDPGVTGGNSRFIHNVVYTPSGIPHAPCIYVAGEGDYVHGYQKNSDGSFAHAAFAVANTDSTLPKSGANMTYSSDFTQSGTTGILWLTSPGHGNHGVTRGLYALHGDTLKTLWSDLSPAFGSGVYWNPPVVVNGHVYAPTSVVIVGVPVDFLYAYALSSSHFLISPSRGFRAIRFSFQTSGNASAISVGRDGSLFARAEQSGTWNVPTALSSAGFAPASAAVAVDQQTATQGDGFIVANDGKLYMTSTTNSAWSAPVALTSANFAPPGATLATATQGGQLGVAVVDNSGKLQIIWWNPAVGWAGPVAVTGANYAPPGAGVIVGRRASGELDVFSIGSDGALKYMAFYAGAWSGPWSLTLGNFAPPGAPVATANDVHGYLNAFTVGNDGALYTKWDCTSAWCGPTALTATGFAPKGANLSSVNFNNQSLNVFLIDNTGTIDVLSNAGISWTTPSAIGSSNFAQPGAPTTTAIESNQLDVFAVAAATQAGVVESVSTGGAWSSPVQLQ
jgi:hypothetical protein